jgi:hypothetical protein
MSIEQQVVQRGITRLCHFTESRNLAYMHDGPDAVLSTAELIKTQRATFNPTDRQRFDGQVDKICCSIEYPNVWYFEKARNKELIYPDWVVLLIEPSRLWATGTAFCPCNASKGSGMHIGLGDAAFDSLFATRGPTIQVRWYRHLPCSPTDDQAEVLVQGPIALSSLLGVGVIDQAQARREFARLEQLGYDASRFCWIIAPHFFRKRELSGAIRRGERPVEKVWLPG